MYHSIYRIIQYIYLVLFIAYGQAVVAGPQKWTGYIQVNGVGSEGQGADIAFTNLDGDARPEMVLMAYDNPSGANSFRYRVGWNVNDEGTASSWTGFKQVNGVGWEGQGAGLAFVNLDSDTRPEMILMAYDNPSGANSFRYRIGWNVNTKGEATSWSPYREVTGVGSEGQGASVAVGNIDNNPRPDMLLIAYDNPAKDNQFRMRIGWNLDNTGTANSWTRWRKVAGMGYEGQGAGAALLNLNSDARPDLVLMAYDNPSGSNNFRYRIAYDLDSNGVPTAWGPFAKVDGAGSQGQGAGVAFTNLDANSRQEMVMVAYDNPSGANNFRYRIGWNWDRNPPELQLIHAPLHPGKNEKVTFTAAASDPDGLKNIEILVNRKLVKTCTNSPCTYTGGPYPSYEGTAASYGANAYDTGGARAWTGYRAFAIGNYPNKAVPILVHGSPDQKIDVVFIRDADSYNGSLRTCTLPDGTAYTCGGGEARFLLDVSGTIRNSYLADELLGANIYRFNFWYFKDTGTTGELCINNPPSSYSTDAAFADSGAIIHTDPFRDCATGGVFSSEPTSYRTFVHESGHAVFGLADEYCCDGGYWQPDPWPNLYTSLSNCETDAKEQAWSASDCKSITRTSDGTKFWLSDRDDLMAGCAGGFPSCAPGDFNFDRGCRRRTIWVLDKLP